MTTTDRGTVILLPAALVVALALLLAGCPKQPDMGETTPAGPAVARGPAAPTPPTSRGPDTRISQPPTVREATLPGPVRSTTVPKESPLKDVFFDYDTSLLTEDAKGILHENLAWLRANPRTQITVEGHCDERGTAEYNLALGERRAKAVRDYLVAAGIEGGRVRTVSYGKERPFVQGHDESAWRANRRGHFVVAR